VKNALQMLLKLNRADIDYNIKWNFMELYFDFKKLTIKSIVQTSNGNLFIQFHGVIKLKQYVY